MIIEQWDPTHPGWPELTQFVAAQQQSDWLVFAADFHRASHVLVARDEEVMLGFVRFVIQEIGPDSGCPPVTLDGLPLLEAKVLAFAVDAEHRRQGIGTALQREVLRQARVLGCYQVRSHSSGANAANHRLKLALGFGVHPIVRGDDNQGVYFIMPLTAGDF